MTENKKKILLIGGIILIGLCGTSYNLYLGSLKQIYTVGRVEKIWKPLKGGTVANYHYKINGDIFSIDVSNYDYEKIALPKKRFLVKIPKGHLREGVMLLSVPVPDYVIPPDSGWKERPKYWMRK